MKENKESSEKKQYLSWALKGTSRQNRHRDEKLPIKYGGKEIGHLGQIMLRQQKEIMEDLDSKAKVLEFSH